MQPALFQAYPGLRERIPHRPFLEGPTAVEPFDLEGVPAGRLFVKRDDRSCPLYGGNKPRKLEFVIADALARGARRLVTSGGLGTNHGLATTLLGAEVGLATTLVLLHQPVTEDVRRKLLLFAACGAELVYGRNVAGVALASAGVLAGSALRGERPYLVAPGGSSARGTAGFVSAGLELAAQVREGALPEPRRVYTAVGTGGTLAGLVLGLRLAGLATRVVGVVVTDVLPPTRRRLAAQARATLRMLRRHDPAVPNAAIAPGDFDLASDQVGPGYGAPTEAAQRAVRAAARAGLALETTYTGKCLAALRAHAAAGALDGPVLFWNTYDGGDPAARAPRPLDPARVPPAFRRFLATEEAPGRGAR